MAGQPTATLLTDFGTTDPYVAAMKGVILSISPQTRIVDISHEVPPQDVLAGAFVLAQAAPYFPPGTVHVVVIDPGVGTDRAILVARMAGQLFVFPDNGVITFAVERMSLEAIFVVRQTNALLPGRASATFHGRDIFAPVAGRLLNGLGIEMLGPRPDSYKLLDLPPPGLAEGGIVGQVIYVDRFGNLVSNVPERMVRQRYVGLDGLRVLCGGRDVGRLRRTYGLVGGGQPLALLDSFGYVEVAVNRGRACDVLKAGVGTEVRIVEG